MFVVTFNKCAHVFVFMCLTHDIVLVVTCLTHLFVIMCLTHAFVVTCLTHVCGHVFDLCLWSCF